jgi:hypothetical protein
MRFIKIINLIVVATLLLAHAARAEEEAGAEKKGSGGESAGEAIKKGGEGTGNSGFVEYSKHLNKMTQLQTKVKESTDKLKELIEQKNHGTTSVKGGEKEPQENILTAIAKEHKELTKNTDAYNDEYREITYRFPSKGEEIKRKYIPLRPKSLDQVEREMGLEGDLTALKDKVDEKYKAFAPPTTPTPTPNSKPVESTLIDKRAEKPPRLKLSK